MFHFAQRNSRGSVRRRPGVRLDPFKVGDNMLHCVQDHAPVLGRPGDQTRSLQCAENQLRGCIYIEIFAQLPCCNSGGQHSNQPLEVQPEKIANTVLQRSWKGGHFRGQRTAEGQHASAHACDKKIGIPTEPFSCFRFTIKDVLKVLFELDQIGVYRVAPRASFVRK